MQKSSYNRISIHIVRYQTDLLIVASRLLLASFVFLAAYSGIVSAPFAELDRNLMLDQALRIGLVVNALILLIIAWQRKQPSKPSGWTICILDFLFAAALLFLAGEPTIESSVLFVFLMACAGLRWYQRGLWLMLTAIVVVHLVAGAAQFGVVGYSLRVFLGHAASAGLLTAVGLTIWYSTQAAERAHREQSILADWPRDISGESAITMLLSTIAKIYDVPRVLMIWEEPDEPWCTIAYYNNGKMRLEREEPGVFEPLTAKALSDSHFLCPDLRLGLHTLTFTDSQLGRWHGQPVNTKLRDYFSLRGALCLRLDANVLKARLFVLDKADMTSDDLILGEIIARQVASDLWQLHVQQRLLSSMANEERMRLARDLHDGLLQSLTGFALRLQTVQSQFTKNPLAARELLQDVQDAIVVEQRDLRAVVKKLRPTSLDSDLINLPLSERLRELSRSVRRNWNINVNLNVDTPQPMALAGIDDQLYRIAQEAMNNAARHSGGDNVSLDFAADDKEVRMIVRDDGHGFSFQGRHDLSSLNDMETGPVSLKDRVASLGGRLIVDSSDAGAKLEIIVPMSSTELLQETQVS